jgi:hypothetical protein
MVRICVKESRESAVLLAAALVISDRSLSIFAGAKDAKNAAIEDACGCSAAVAAATKGLGELPSGVNVAAA